MKTSSLTKLKELEKKVKDLEQAVGQKQIKIDYLEKMIDIAKEELNIDIKKISAPHNQLVPKQPRRNELFNELAVSSYRDK